MTVFAPTAAAESGPTSAQPVPLHVAKDNCAKRGLIPIENERNLLDLSANIMEHVAPILFGDPKTAAMRVLGGSR